MLDGLTLFFPCCNEEANIGPLIHDAVDVAARIASQYEILIIDDGSTDKTAESAQRFTDSGLPIRVIRHPKRLGYGATIRSGLQAARFPWIFFSDGDRQFYLEELLLLIGQRENSDIVAGYRKARADPVFRQFNAKCFHIALRLFFDLKIRDVNCAFKLIKSSAMKQLSLHTSGAMINAELLIKARRGGFMVTELPVAHRPRMAGQQSGARLDVLWKAIQEFFSLWYELRVSHASK